MTDALYEHIATLHSLAPSAYWHNATFSNKGEAIMAAYRALTREQAVSLAEQAVEIYLTPFSREYQNMSREEQRKSSESEKKYIASEILRKIPGYFPDVLQTWHRRLFDEFLGFRASPIFLNLEPSVLSELLDQLREPPDPPSKRRLTETVYVLSWTPTDAVVQKIRALRDNPSAWFDKPYDDQLTLYAGWVLTDAGHRRDLTLPIAYDLEPRPSADQESSVRVLHYVDESCPWCNRRLVDLFDFDLTDPALAFMNFSGTRLRIRTCVICIQYVWHIYSRIDLNGAAAWDTDTNSNIGRDYDADRDDWWEKDYEFPEGRLVFGGRRPTPYEALVHTFDVASQVGGHPAWLQHADYPKCPGCEKYMTFVAQVETEAFSGHPNEGTYYAHVCASCGYAAIVYQQT